MSRQSPKLRHRSSRVVPASITALVLLAVGVLSSIVAVLRLSSGQWPAPAVAVGDFLTATSWGSVVWIAICAGVGFLGLVMVVAAMKRGRVNASRLTWPEGQHPRGELVITRKGTARLAAARAEEIDGVESVSVTVSGRTVRLRVRTPSQQRAEIKERVNQRVGQSLQQAGLTPAPTIRTTVTTQEI